MKYITMAKEKIGSIDELKYDEHNFNKHTAEGLKLLEKSLEQNKFGRSILVDKDNNIIAGNGIVETARKLGKTKIRFVETSGEELVVVKRNDLHIDSKEGRELALADNATSAANLQWDEKELAFAKDNWGVQPDDWGVDVDWEEEPTKAKEDDYEAPEELPSKVKPGEIWQLGEHRLMCGDSTKVEDVERLMGGSIADLVFTDPPYGVNIVSNNKVGGDKPYGNVGGNNIKANKYMPIKGDKTTETARLSYDIIKDISKEQIIFGGNYFTDFLPPRACWIIWDKQNTGNFADVEMAWTSINKGAKLYKWLWNGLCRKGDRFIEGNKRMHPTQKPVGLIADILNDFTKENEIILDCFGGSGSTMIACEQINRKCLMVEYEPHYCDVIINRWETLTGQKATKIE